MLVSDDGACQAEGQFSPVEGEPGPNHLAEAWYCVHTYSKHEHIAAAHLQQQWELEVYLPRIRFKRATRVGPLWFTEALFPNYLFARFALADFQRKVRHARSVREIVHFGDNWPTIPAVAIEELRARFGTERINEVPEDLQVGDSVVIAGGTFHNLAAIVSRVMSSRQRVAVLLDFLGRQTAVELDRSSVIRQGNAREALLGLAH